MEDLEEEIENWIRTNHFVFTEIDEIIKTARHFAEWQKRQMMKDAAECDVVKNGNKSDCLVWKDSTAFKRIISKLNNSDKVKIIIIKEEQQ